MTRIVYLAAFCAITALTGLAGCSNRPTDVQAASEIAPDSTSALPGETPPAPATAAINDSVRERTIFGADDRRRTPFTHANRLRVGKLEAPKPGNKVSGCTATSIGGNHVLTAAHCVYDTSSSIPRLYDTIHFYPAAGHHNQMPHGRFRVTRVHHPEHLNGLAPGLEKLHNDIAVLEISEDDGGNTLRRFIGTFGIWGRSALQDGTMSTLGYPGDKESRVQYHQEDCPYEIFSRTLLRTYCDVFSGQSGSPVLLYSEKHGESHIHGVISAEAEQANYATRITPERQRTILAIVEGRYDMHTSDDEERWTSIDMPAAQHIHVMLHNTCRQTLHVALQYREDNGNWTEKGFFVIEPGHATELAQTRNSIFYVHVRDTEGNILTDGTHQVAMHGSTFGFRQLNHSYFGDTVIRPCN